MESCESEMIGCMSCARVVLSWTNEMKVEVLIV